MSVTLLITGFGPFPGAPTNPTGPLALRLAHRRRPAFGDARRVAHVFRTSYAAVERELPALLAHHKPDAILMLGLAARTRHLRIETRARNTVSTVIPDADGRRPILPALSANARTSMPARAPTARLWQSARAAGVPARLSSDAGRYLCNALFWHALDAAARAGEPKVAAFVHVPQLRPDLTLARLTRAGEAILLGILAATRQPR
jgi:pyroglutamyl-peptidase